MERLGSARWEGDLKSGRGTVRLGSGLFEGAYSFGTRFESAPGTNPEELIGAAHAACFSMAFASGLAKVGFPPRSVDTTATVTVEKVGNGFGISGITLRCHVEAGNISPNLLQQTADDAKANCPVSKALAAVPIRLELT